jgi:hypothetical protein
MDKITKPLDSQGRLAQDRRIDALRNAVKIMRKQKAVIKYLKWIALAFAFAWLVLVTRHEYFIVESDGLFRVNRLTSNVQYFHPDKLEWVKPH